MSASSTSAALSTTPLAGDLPTLQFPVIVDDQEVFAPDPFEVVPGEEVLLKFLGTGSADVNVYELDTETPYALFKGSSNPYTVSSDGTPYTVRDDAPEDTSYTIVYQSSSALEVRAAGTADAVSVVAVRGTINVRKPTR
jgi:hypothetical protein